MAGGTLTINVPNVTNQGTMQATAGGTLAFNGSIAVNGNGILTDQASASISVSGNLVGDTRNVDRFVLSGAVQFNGSGRVALPQLLEAMSQDLRG